VEGRDGKLTQPWRPAFDLAFTIGFGSRVNACDDHFRKADLSLQIQIRWTVRRFSCQAYVPSTPLRE
jgi:hypothetical protein